HTRFSRDWSSDVCSSDLDIGSDGQPGFGEPAARSAFLPALTDEFAREAARLLRSGRVYFFQLRAMGGAICDTPPEETAFAHRTRSEERRVGKEERSRG